jgi:hypothetical protein
VGLVEKRCWKMVDNVEVRDDGDSGGGMEHQ